jgi:phosphate transport system substrate-binding protein
MRIERFSGWLIAAAAMALVACGGAPSASTTTTPATDVGSGQLQGAGATFPAPYYTKAFYAYNQKYSQVSVNYQAIGSGGGIQAFTKNTVDFGASDVPMTATEVAAAGGDSTLVQLPTIIGVVAIAYNLPGVDNLKMDGPTLANIYMGTIKKWNDPAITALNSGANLPNSDITVVHRADSSGTSFAFTDYLSKISPDWKTKVGAAKAPAWPVGVGGSQNAGVGQAVKTTEGAVGYVELAYVIQSQLQYASLKNANGKFLKASLDGATAAASTVSGISPTNFSITNAAGDKAYAIVSYSWVILRKDQTDATKGKAVVNLFKWVVTDAYKDQLVDGKSLQYASLPTETQTFALNQLKTVTSGGKPILT